MTDIGRYHLPVSDLLVRDVPADDVARIDAQARRLGVSRNEFLRRRLHQIAAFAPQPLTGEHLRLFSERFADLDDAEVMRQAWS